MSYIIYHIELKSILNRWNQSNGSFWNINQRTSASAVWREHQGFLCGLIWRLTPPFLSGCLRSDLQVHQFTSTHVSGAESEGTCAWGHTLNTGSDWNIFIYVKTFPLTGNKTPRGISDWIYKRTSHDFVTFGTSADSFVVTPLKYKFQFLLSFHPVRWVFLQHNSSIAGMWCGYTTSGVDTLLQKISSLLFISFCLKFVWCNGGNIDNWCKFVQALCYWWFTW